MLENPGLATQPSPTFLRPAPNPFYWCLELGASEGLAGSAKRPGVASIQVKLASSESGPARVLRGWVAKGRVLLRKFIYSNALFVLYLMIGDNQLGAASVLSSR